ncbi:MAG TPA: hypothetical protein VFJ16_15650, partial [Longimicrobium sp.]|nr:hypothetical protein [Longimicrobium sp.]
MADFTRTDTDAEPHGPPARPPAGDRARHAGGPNASSAQTEDDPGSMEALLRTLTSLSGPTGEEDEVLDWVRRAWEPLGEVTQSPVGNLFLHLPGPGKRVLLAAHADELSLIVRSISPDGFLRVLPGERDQFSAPYFIGSPVKVLADGGPLPGV